MFLIDPIGKTLAELHNECGANKNGYSVFVLRARNDYIGDRLDQDVSIGAILKRHTEYAEHVVVYENTHNGMWVLRVAKGDRNILNARIPSRERHVDPGIRIKIRQHIKAEIHLTLVEVFLWGADGKRMQELDAFAQKFLEKYDELYDGDPRAEHAAIINRLKAAGISHECKKGSGIKVEYAHEHDMALLPYLLGLRKLQGFGRDRLNNLIKDVNKRTVYYNNTFAGESDSALYSMHSRLDSYGRKKKQ